MTVGELREDENSNLLTNELVRSWYCGHLSTSKSSSSALPKYALNSSLIPTRSIKFSEGHSQGRTGVSLGGSSSTSRIASLGPCFLEEPPWNIFLSILFSLKNF